MTNGDLQYGQQCSQPRKNYGGTARDAGINFSVAAGRSSGMRGVLPVNGRWRRQYELIASWSSPRNLQRINKWMGLAGGARGTRQSLLYIG
ncbi:hypothetical protein NL676_022931 [Syzygium grande]|nr:hypothetical protein NL676_022931 [Syzygium grande]